MQAPVSPLSDRLRRLKFRAWHHGTREADYMIGCFFDRYHTAWSETEIDLFERMVEEEDVDIMAWALGTMPAPPTYAGAMMNAMIRLDYVDIPR